MPDLHTQKRLQALMDLFPQAELLYLGDPGPFGYNIFIHYDRGNISGAGMVCLKEDGTPFPGSWGRSVAEHDGKLKFTAIRAGDMKKLIDSEAISEAKLIRFNRHDTMLCDRLGGLLRDSNNKLDMYSWIK